jgi:3-isopropylmalate/(R)-2-methylmalate dehydratase small subunit
VWCGDVIVAGPRFGIGSSREQAASVLVHLGVAAVIAPSYAGLYFRNAFNVGLLLLTCPEADAIADATALQVDARAACIELAGGRVLRCTPIPGFLLDMVDAGGLLPILERRLKTRQERP